jgi:hypothetical protein
MFNQRRIGIVAALVVVLLLGGCTASLGRSSVEPGTLAFRNATGRVLQTLTVSEVHANPLAGARLGRFENVPPGATQTVQRPADAQRLPDRAIVEWRMAGDSPVTRNVNLAAILRSADSVTPEMTLLFEVFPGRVAISVVP